MPTRKALIYTAGAFFMTLLAGAIGIAAILVLPRSDDPPAASSNQPTPSMTPSPSLTATAPATATATNALATATSTLPPSSTPTATKAPRSTPTAESTPSQDTTLFINCESSNAVRLTIDHTAQGYIENEQGHVYGLAGDPNATVIDDASFHAGSHSGTFGFETAGNYTGHFRIVDGPDEVHVEVQTFDGSGQINGEATFWVPADTGDGFTILFGSGRSPAEQRLEIDHDHDGQVDETREPDVWVTGPAACDETAPETRAEVVEAGDGQAVVKLIANDGPDGAGVVTTAYLILDATNLHVLEQPDSRSGLQIYTGPITLTQPSLLLFRSYDHAGNIEAPHDVTVLGGLAPDVAAALAVDGTPLTIETEIPGQNARVTFAGEAGQSVSLAITDVTIGDSPFGGIVLTIVNPDGTALKVYDAISAQDFLLEFTLGETGQHTILVDPELVLTGSATLSLHQPVDIQAALTLDGQPLVLHFETPGQNAELTFVGAEGQELDFTIDDVTVTASRCDLDGEMLASTSCAIDIEIWTPSGEQLHSGLFRVEPSEGGSAVLRLPESGVYRIVIDPRRANTGSLTVTLAPR